MNEKDEAAAGALDAINELHDDVERVATERDQALAEVERLRDLAKALCGERDVDAAFEALEAMTAEVERLRTALERHHDNMIRKPFQVGCGYCGLSLADNTRETEGVHS